MQQMTEYWINVYHSTMGISYQPWPTRIHAVRMGFGPLLYRIHVKMKSVEDKEIVVEQPWQVPKDLPVGTKVKITGPKIYNWRDIYS